MDWQLTCRVCLETGDMVSLFDWDENNEQLSEKFTYCCGIQVAKDDSLPTLICLNCVDRLTFSYQFKQQCITSNETLRECLDEFLKSSSAVTATAAGDSSKSSAKTETITIKQENGVLLQYDLPIEQETTWTRSYNSDKMSVVSSAPQQKKRGRPRKYPNNQGQIDVSPYQRKKPKKSRDHQSLTSLLATGTLDMKEEPQSGMEDNPDGDFEADHDDTDPEFSPGAEMETEQPSKKRGRPSKGKKKKKKPDTDQEDVEDVLLQETIMAYSEPIPEHILNPKPKEKRKYAKKKYTYDKSHICETCGAAFTSNASLQAHIRRHLGIKPFVCSLCGYSCVANTALKRHMLRHTGEKPYKCRICERRFADFGTRQKHERLHMGVRPYQCSLCGKAFTYSYVLSNHMLTHTGEKKYSCAPCNKKFTKAHHLKYHNKVHHKDLYLQQQIEAEAKKMRQQINITGLSGVITGTIVDGTLQLVQATNEDNENEGQMQVVEEVENEMDEDKETDRAVAEMQAVGLHQDENDDYILSDVKGD